MMLLAMSQAGGGDPSAAYMDPILAYMTGAYTPERRWTDAELANIYAPTLSAYVDFLPDGTLAPKRGVSGDRLKEVEAILEGVSPYDIAGKNRDDREYMDFLQSLAEERAKLAQQQLSRDSRKDQFEEMGLPGYGKGYSVDQIFSMYGDYLGATPQRLAGTESNTARLAARNRKMLEEYRAKSGTANDAEIARLEAERAEFLSKGDAARADNRYRKIQQLRDKSKGAEKQAESYGAALDRESQRAAYSPGGEKFEALRAETQAKQLAAALEAAGRSPLSDALVSAAMLKRVLGR